MEGLTPCRCSLSEHPVSSIQGHHTHLKPPLNGGVGHSPRGQGQLTTCTDIAGASGQGETAEMAETTEMAEMAEK